MLIFRINDILLYTNDNLLYTNDILLYKITPRKCRVYEKGYEHLSVAILTCMIKCYIT